MSEYLLPTNSELTVEQKQRLFAVKTRMTNIPSNYPKPGVTYTCPCGQSEDMQHIYFCEIIKEEKQTNLDYEKIYNGNISQQIEVFRKFETNLERRTELRIGPIFLFFSK